MFWKWLFKLLASKSKRKLRKYQSNWNWHCNHPSSSNIINILQFFFATTSKKGFSVALCSFPFSFSFHLKCWSRCFSCFYFYLVLLPHMIVSFQLKCAIARAHLGMRSVFVLLKITTANVRATNAKRRGIVSVRIIAETSPIFKTWRFLNNVLTIFSVSIPVVILTHFHFHFKVVEVKNAISLTVRIQ